MIIEKQEVHDIKGSSNEYIHCHRFVSEWCPASPLRLMLTQNPVYGYTSILSFYFILAYYELYLYISATNHDILDGLDWTLRWVL